MVVLSIPRTYYQPEGFTTLVCHIRDFCIAQKIPFTEQYLETIDELRQVGAKKRKQAFMLRVTEQFPELRYCYERELRNRKKYYIKLFEAVAVAMLHRK